MGIRDLGILVTSSSEGQSEATDINNTGQVTGWSDGFAAQHAFITGPNGVGMTEIGAPAHFTYGSGINDAGQVVGYSFYLGAPHADNRAFITGPNGMGMRDLGILSASGINDTGQVVGGFATPEGVTHAFITGPMAWGGPISVRWGVPVSPKASMMPGRWRDAGWSTTPEGVSHAFITGPNGVGMVDLNSLIDLPNNLILTNAIDINNAGQVLALTAVIPEPQTYAMLLGGLGLVGFMARRKKMAG